MSHSASIFSQSLWYPPAWWVKAFDEELAPTKNTLAYSSSLQKRSIWPPLDKGELNLLLVILTSIQNELLHQTEYCESVVLEIAAIGKSLPQISPQSKKTLERLFFSLAQIKVVDDFDRKSSSNSYNISGLPIFAADNIRISTDGNTSLELKLSPHSSEIVFGICDLYQELSRHHKKLGLISTSSHRPLFGLWRSAWLDTHGLEGDYFLLMERALNWEHRRASFEGHVVGSIDDFFKCFTSQKKFRQPKALEPNWIEFHKSLARFFRKLINHGYLTAHPADNLDIAALPPKPHMVWQVSPLRLSAALTQSYLQNAARNLLFRHSHDLSVAEVFWRTRAQPQWREMLRTFLLRVATPRNAHEKIYVNNKNSCIILLPLLFIEWTSRLNSADLLPLPEDISHAPITELLSLEGEIEEILQRYFAFEEVINKNILYQDAIFREPRSTYALLSLDKTSEAENIISHLFSGAAFETNVVNMPLKPVSQTSAEVSPRVNMSPGSEPTASSPATSQFHKLKKLAADELKKITTNSPKAYENLKNTFFSSLDDSGKQLFFELRSQMSHELFEGHLQRRLIDFMAKNPSNWSKNNNQKNA